MASDLQDRLELALLASNEGVWDWYVGEREIYYSDRVLDFLGYPADKAPNIILQARKYFHQDEVAELRDTFKKIVKKNGMTPWRMIVAICILMDLGGGFGFVG